MEATIHECNHRRLMMSKVRFETSDALGLITLANPPLNLFDQELIDDLRTAVGQARQHPLRALLVRADGKNFSGGADVAIFKGKTARKRASASPAICERSPTSKNCRFQLSLPCRGLAWRRDWNSHLPAI